MESLLHCVCNSLHDCPISPSRPVHVQSNLKTGLDWTWTGQIGLIEVIAKVFHVLYSDFFGEQLYSGTQIIDSTTNKHCPKGAACASLRAPWSAGLRLALDCLVNTLYAIFSHLRSVW